MPLLRHTIHIIFSHTYCRSPTNTQNTICIHKNQNTQPDHKQSIFSNTHTHISILSHIHTQTIINSCICENILVCVRIFSPKHTDKYFLPHTHIQVVSPPQTHTHTHTHTLTHTRIRAERQGLGLRMLHVCSIRRQIKTDFVFHIKGRHALGFSPSLPSSSPPPLLPPSLPLSLSLTLPHRFMNK